MLRLSKSRLNTFLACGEKYRLQYELGLSPLRKARALVEGSCIHHLVESGLMYGKYIEDVLDFASQAFWAEHPLEACDYEDEQAYTQAKTICLSQSQAFLKQLGPLEVADIERKVETPLIHPISHEQDPEVELIGFIDLIITDKAGTPWLIDLKTASKKPREGMAQLALELSVYAYMLALQSEEASFREHPVALVYLIRTKEPHVLWDEGRRSLPHFVEVHRICQKVAEDIRNASFFRNPGMHCSWCDFASLCYSEKAKAIQTFGLEAWEYYHDAQAATFSEEVVNF